LLPASERLALHRRALATRSRPTSPGDVVLDPSGRGGWVARAAVDHQRRAIALESNPLTRLLADVVLRPPDVRHLDAAFQAIAAAPRQQSSLKVSIGDLFATRCPRCGRSVVADDFIWEAPADRDDDPGAAGPTPEPLQAGSRGTIVRKHYRCLTCRDQVGGGDQRHAPVDEADIERASAVEARSPAWRAIHDRFPTPDGGEALVDHLLELHSPRQLIGLQAILERIETDLRAAPVEAALRLALLHAILPASRLNGFPGRVTMSGSAAVACRRREPMARAQPWIAEDGYRLVRGFVHDPRDRARAGQARFGDDIRARRGRDDDVVRLSTPTALRALAAEGAALKRLQTRPRIRLVLGQPPLRPNVERLSYTYLATSWVLGRDAAALLPLEGLFGTIGRAPWSWQAAALRRVLAAVEPLLGRDSRAILLVEPGGPEALVTAVLGGVGAGYRLTGARLAEPGEDIGGTVELVPPGGVLPTSPRTRANVPLPPVPGGPGDPDLVPGRGLFAPPERFDQRPLSAADIARTITETSVAVLQARGEPARYEQLLGEILVGLDRAGQLRRLVTVEHDAEPTEPAARIGAVREVRIGDVVRARPDIPHEGVLRGRRRPGARPDAAASPTRRRPGRHAPRPHPGRAHAAGPPAAAGGRAGPLVARLAGRPRRRRGAAGRSRGVGRLQPPLDRRPALGSGVLRADRPPVHRLRLARRDPRAGLP
jgi:hypothetical protein